MPSGLRSGLFVLAAALVTLSLATETAVAAGQRSFVSTRGVDNPTCALTSPCRTFGAAVAATAPGGEVIVLDSGGYGPVTLAQSVAIVSPPGIYAGISVLSGQGVTIAAAAGDTVILRGLTIVNQGSSGRGIYITSAGFVRIEDVHVSGFHGAPGFSAIPASPLQLQIRRSVFRGNLVGFTTNPVASTTAQITGTLEGVEISNSDFDGLVIGNNVFLSLSRSLVTKNGFGIAFGADAGQANRLDVDDCEVSANVRGLAPGDTPGDTFVHITRSRMIENGIGIWIGANSTTRIAASVVANNSSGIKLNGGLIESSGDNVLRGNTIDEPFLTQFPLR